MTAREAKVRALCVCYSSGELMARQAELSAGRKIPVPGRLIDTASPGEIAEAIREYDCGRFSQERGIEGMLQAHHGLILGHMADDRFLGKALERGLRGLCVREGREYLQDLLDGVRPGPADGYPWRGALDATPDELAWAVALYDDRLYRHLRGLAGKTDLDRMVFCEEASLAERKAKLLAGEEARVPSCDPFWTASVELLDRAMEEFNKPARVSARRLNRRRCERFEYESYYYFVTDGSDMGTFIGGLDDPDTMVPLLGMACLEEADPRRVAEFFVRKFRFRALSWNEPAENVACVQHVFSGLTDLVPGFDYGNAHEFFRVDVRAVRAMFSDKDMAAMARSIDWEKCSRRLFS